MNIIKPEATNPYVAYTSAPTPLSNISSETKKFIGFFNETFDPPVVQTWDLTACEAYKYVENARPWIIKIQEEVPKFKILPCWSGEECEIVNCTYFHDRLVHLATKHKSCKTEPCFFQQYCTRWPHDCLFSHPGDLLVNNYDKTITLQPTKPIVVFYQPQPFSCFPF